MPAIRVQGFKGVAPRVSPRLLETSMAQHADNARLFAKEVRPYRGLQFVQNAGNGNNTQTIYRYLNAGTAYWFDWPLPVQTARVPVTGDTKNRLFYTGAPDTGGTAAGVPKKTGNDIGIPNSPGGPAAYYFMGVKNPTTAPAKANGGGGTGNAETASWVITYVTGWGEESGPSPPVTDTAYHTGDSVTITRAADTPDSHYNIVAWNLYRTFTGANGVTTYFFVAQQATFATTTLIDTTTDATLVTQGSFPSANQANFAEPPTDLTGLTALPNGQLAGFSPSLKQTCFSEPYFPYAWPVNYRRGLVYDPVAAGASGNMLVVATTSKPAVYIGNSPATMSGDTLDALESCLNVRSLAESPFGVVWATPDGLYMVSPNGVRQIVTRALYDKQTWQSVIPGGMFSAIYDGRYYGWAPGMGHVLVLDPNEPDDALTFLDIQPTAMFSDFNADGLYFCINGQIQKWDADGSSYLQYEWRTKVFTDQRPNNKAWARILFNFNNPLNHPSHVPGNFAAYTAQRAAVLALNAAEQIAAYAGPAVGAHCPGEHCFAADDFFDVPPDIGTAITLNVYADAVLQASLQVVNEDPVRLPGGFLGLEWEAEVQGKVNVEEIALANDMSEIQAID